MFGEASTLVVDSENATTPSLREFDRRVHKAIVFDECAGASFILVNKKVMQAHRDGAKLGSGGS